MYHPIDTATLADGKHVTAKFFVSYMLNNIPDETPSRFVAQLQVAPVF
jgi:hypothetical protein